MPFVMRMRALTFSKVKDDEVDLGEFWAEARKHGLVYQLESDGVGDGGAGPTLSIELYGLLEANDEPHIEKLKSILLETYYLYIFAKMGNYEKQADQRNAPLDDSDDEMFIFPYLYTRLPKTRPAFFVCPVTRVRCLTAIPPN